MKKFRDELCGIYCKACLNNCCSGRFNPNVGNSCFFSKLPVLKNMDDKNIRPFLFKQSLSKRYLVGKCPYLNNENLCGIHNEKKRPDDCQKYPIYLSYPMDISVFIPFIQAETSCEIFKISDNCRKAINFAKELGLEVNFC